MTDNLELSAILMKPFCLDWSTSIQWSAFLKVSAYLGDSDILEAFKV